MKENQTNFWEIHFPDIKEREDAQSIYKRLIEIFSDKEDISSFIHRLEKCVYLECKDFGKEENQIQIEADGSCKKILDHYGITADETAIVSAFNSRYLNRMCEVIGNIWKINSRARIIIDYDPDCLQSVVRTEIFENQNETKKE